MGGKMKRVTRLRLTRAALVLDRTLITSVVIFGLYLIWKL